MNYTFNKLHATPWNQSELHNLERVQMKAMTSVDSFISLHIACLFIDKHIGTAKVVVVVVYFVKDAENIIANY
jgi:hypothetical protein